MFIRAAGEPAGEKIDAVSAPCGVVDAAVITLYLMKGKGRAIRLVKPFVRDKTCGLFLGDTPRPHFHCFRGDHRCSTSFVFYLLSFLHKVLVYISVLRWLIYPVP